MALLAKFDLLSGATADGNGDSVDFRDYSGSGRSQTVYCWGTFDTATAKVQASIDGTQWFDVPDASFTAQGSTTLNIAATFLRGVVSGAGATTNLNMSIGIA